MNGRESQTNYFLLSHKESPWPYEGDLVFPTFCVCVSWFLVCFLVLYFFKAALTLSPLALAFTMHK